MMLLNMMGGKKLAATLNFTAGDMKLDYTDTSAMCFDANASPQDLSGYAGVGAASYLLNFYAGETLVAHAYAGAAGGGETLGSELILNGNMETDDPPASWDSNGGSTLSSVADERTAGAGSKSLNAVRGSSLTAAYQVFNITLGALYKCSGWAKNGDATNAMVRFTGGLIWLGQIVTEAAGTWASGTAYTTATTTLGQANALVTGATGEYGRYDDISAKKLTDVAATGLLLYKDRALSTRGVTAAPGAASVNSISQIKIFAVR